MMRPRISPWRGSSSSINPILAAILPGSTPASLFALSLLGEDIAVLGVGLWLLRPKRLEDLQGNASTLLWLLGLGMRITALLLAVAIVANVAGNVTLARMLTQALVNSLFTAAVLGAALRGLEFVLVALLHSHPARRLRMVRRRGRFQARALQPL